MNIFNLKEITSEQICSILDLAKEFKNGKKVDYKRTKNSSKFIF